MNSFKTTSLGNSKLKNKTILLFVEFIKIVVTINFNTFLSQLSTGLTCVKEL